MSVRRQVAILLSAIVAAGCGGAQESDPEVRVPATESTDARPAAEPTRPQFAPIEKGSDLDRMIDDHIARGEARMAAAFPCSLFKTEEVAELVGGSVEGGMQKMESRMVSVMGDPGATRRWRAQTCAWHSVERNGPEIDEIAVSLPAHFESGAVECPPAPGAGASGVETVSDLGDTAWWKFDRYGHGTLTSCSTAALVVVEATVRGSASDALLQIARHAAERALAAVEEGGQR
jgi:hypothetical protein